MLTRRFHHSKTLPNAPALAHRKRRKVVPVPLVCRGVDESGRAEGRRVVPVQRVMVHGVGVQSDVRARRDEDLRGYRLSRRRNSLDGEVRVDQRALRDREDRRHEPERLVEAGSRPFLWKR